MEITRKGISELSGFSMAKIHKDIERGNLDIESFDKVVGYVISGLVSNGASGLGVLGLEGGEGGKKIVSCSIGKDSLGGANQVEGPPSWPVDSTGESESVGYEPMNESIEQVPDDNIEGDIIHKMQSMGKTRAQAEKAILSLRLQAGSEYLTKDHLEELGL